MRKKLFPYILIITVFILLPTLPDAQTAYLCGREDAVQVLGREYIVYNNIWGSNAGEQCIDVNGTNFIVSLSTHNSSGVAAYPCIYKGFHYWHSETVDSGLPLRISETGSVPVTWEIAGTNAGGTWNASYESWFSQGGSANPANGGELMIWINYAGSATPGGSQVGTVSLEGYTWDVFYADWDWNYVAYRTTNRMNTISFNFKSFIDDAVSRGYLSPNWYLDALEAGFEIWEDGQGLESVSFTGHAYTSSATPEPTGGKIGDANNDGSIDIVDALLIAQYYVGLPAGIVREYADTNCDRSIDIVDALLVAQYYVGLIEEFC
ncbi:MAG: hypothetical protein JXB88_19120 [Spirochaetales bacterium]|nr:hypothetical protein [Spirochaetales bacterium]